MYIHAEICIYISRMESVLCVYNRVILCGNINREGKHFFDLIFGKKMEIKNLRDIRMRI